MVRGWQRALLLVIALGVFLALVSPYIPDPLSIPGRNMVFFAIFLMVMFFPHTLLVSMRSFAAFYQTIEQSAADRLALNCSRLC